jgi:hypothetical protein
LVSDDNGCFPAAFIGWLRFALAKDSSNPGQIAVAELGSGARTQNHTSLMEATS